MSLSFGLCEILMGILHYLFIFDSLNELIYSIKWETKYGKVIKI